MDTIHSDVDEEQDIEIQSSVDMSDDEDIMETQTLDKAASESNFLNIVGENNISLTDTKGKFPNTATK